MRLIAFACLLMVVAGGARAESTPVVTEHMRAQLLVDAASGVPGGEMTLGLKLEHKQGWHSYWKNPGDSGLPTTLRWTLPQGVVAGPIEWPTPGQFRDGPLLNFGYDGTVLLPVKLTIPADFKSDVLAIGLRARWLVCAEICIPEGGEIALRLPVSKTTRPAEKDAAFATARARLPVDVEGIVPARIQGGLLVFGIDRLPERYYGQTLELYPEIGGVFDHAEPIAQAWAERSWSVRVPLSPQRSESPEFLDMVVKLPGEPSGSRIRLRIAGWPSP